MTKQPEFRSSRPKGEPERRPVKASDRRARAARQADQRARAAQQEDRPEREEATTRTAIRRRERETAERRTQILTIVGVIGAFVFIIVLGLVLANVPAEAPFPGYIDSRYEGVVSTRTNDGYPRLGEPDAPVQVSLYSAFDCAECKPFHDSLTGELVQRVRDSQNRMALIFVPLYGSNAVTNGQGAARAAMCAAEQNSFWQMSEGLFTWQTQFGNQAFINSRINAGVGALNLDRGAFGACMSSTAPDEVLARARRQSSNLLNFDVPPALAINGVIPVRDGEEAGEVLPVLDPAELLTAVDRAVNNISPAQRPAIEATAEATAEVTIEATPEMMMTAETTLEDDVVPTAEVTLEGVQTMEVEEEVEGTAEAGG